MKVRWKTTGTIRRKRWIKELFSPSNKRQRFSSGEEINPETPLTAILDLIFPPVCLTCKSILAPDERYVCDVCISNISYINAPLCTICGRPFFTRDDERRLCGGCIISQPPFDSARALGAYGNQLLKLIHFFKYYERTYLSPLLGRLMTRRDYPDFDPEGFDLIVPVPLHKKRFFERGYNQALLLCQGLKRGWGIPVNHTDLIRTRWTEPQVKLSPKERIKNVKGAFEVKGDIFPKKRVILVDDVFTTGATVKECAKVLKKAGAEYVGVLTLSRVVIK